MSPQNLNSCGVHQEMNFLALSSQLSLSDNFRIKNPEMGFQILSPGSMEKNQKPWCFEHRGAKRRVDERDGVFGVEGDKGLCLNMGDQDAEEVIKRPAASGKNGHTKLCARGHWRPAEDSKLKDLVAQFGPQNWNLIAENLEGRSARNHSGSKGVIRTESVSNGVDGSRCQQWRSRPSVSEQRRQQWRQSVSKDGSNETR